MNHIHDDLDQLVAALARQGFPYQDYLGPGLEPDGVHSAFAKLGLDPPEDLVSLFTWRTVRAEKYFAPLFREVFLHPLDTMIETYTQNREIVDELDEPDFDQRTAWPGPPSWFPALMMDGAEIIAVECGREDRGSVWFAFTQSETVRMYGSLAEAIAAARHCLEMAYWHYDSVKERVQGDGWSPAWLADPVAAPWRITA